MYEADRGHMGGHMTLVGKEISLRWADARENDFSNYLENKEGNLSLRMEYHNVSLT